MINKSKGGQEKRARSVRRGDVLLRSVHPFEHSRAVLGGCRVGGYLANSLQSKGGLRYDSKQVTRHPSRSDQLGAEKEEGGQQWQMAGDGS